MTVVSDLLDQIIFLPRKISLPASSSRSRQIFFLKKKVKKNRSNNQPCGSKLQLKIKPCRNLDMKTVQAKTIFLCKLKQDELIDEIKNG